MPDLGLYTALSAQPDIAAKRNYDARNAQYAQQLAAFSEYQAQQKGAALKEIGDYFGAVDQQINELLPEDMKRVQGVWDKNKQAVIDKLKEFGNDPQMFMRMGGATTVKKFANDFYRSPEMQNAINTKEQLTAGLKDFANPKLELRNVSWTDKNGATQTGSLAEWTKAHQSGDAVDLHYNGAYDKPNIDPLEFAKIPNGGKPVTHSQLFDFMVMKGTAPGDAADYIKKAAPHIMDAKNPNNTVFNWGRERPSAVWERYGMGTYQDEQIALQRVALIQKGIYEDPTILSQVMINQPYKKGLISDVTIVPPGTTTQVGNKMVTSDKPTMIIEYTTTESVEDQYGGKHDEKVTQQDEVPIGDTKNEGVQLINRYFNFNREGTPQFVNPEKVDFLLSNNKGTANSQTQQQPTAPTKGMKKTFSEGPATFDGTKWVLDSKSNPPATNMAERDRIMMDMYEKAKAKGIIKGVTDSYMNYRESMAKARDFNSINEMSDEEWRQALKDWGQ